MFLPNPNTSGTVISSSSPAVALEHGWCSFPKVAKVPNLTRCLGAFQYQLIQKLWERFKFQQPFGKINGWHGKFHYHFKIIVEYQRKPSELRLVGFSIWTELQKWRCLELPGPFFTTWTPISAFGKEAGLVLASRECVSTIFCSRVQ